MARHGPSPARMRPPPLGWPDRDHRRDGEFSAAVPEADRAITHGRIAVHLEPIPLLGMTNIGDGGVVMFGDNPMLDADTLPSQPIRPTGDVARCKDAWRAGLQELVDHNAGPVKSVGGSMGVLAR